ncbi:MAG: hypothetical protein EOP83_03525 [Verrucomicrobiaceae bacterium]|nr:MAG: hypothetical protein EOP83_03525 [Verrucomicrobiaceae bacterium]
MAAERQFIDGIRFTFGKSKDGSGLIELSYHNQLEGVFTDKDEAIKYIRLEVLPQYQVGCGSDDKIGRPRKRWMLDGDKLRSVG